MLFCPTVFHHLAFLLLLIFGLVVFFAPGESSAINNKLKVLCPANKFRSILEKCSKVFHDGVTNKANGCCHTATEFVEKTGQRSAPCLTSTSMENFCFNVIMLCYRLHCTQLHCTWMCNECCSGHSSIKLPVIVEKPWHPDEDLI